jgi:hypothetical protein
MMTTCMTKAYKDSNTDGTQNLYWMYVPGKHRGWTQGYVGRTKLKVNGLKMRYRIEDRECFSTEAIRKPRRVNNFVRRYWHEVKIVMIAENLSVEEAKEIEKRLRPKDNSDGKDKFNWNTKKGG